MISEEQNTALLTIGKSALENPLWIDFANYCFNREQGLRRDAFNHLEKFIQSTVKWSFESKVKFLGFLFPFFEAVNSADYVAFPQPLKDRFIKPVLEEWCKIEQLNSNPFRWYGRYFNSEEYLFKALSINPIDDEAREVLIMWWSYEIYSSVNNLPDYYYGEPFEDSKLANKAKEQIKLLSDGTKQSYWTSEIDEDLEMVENYINWKNSGHPDFEIWGQENKKKVGYNYDYAVNT